MKNKNKIPIYKGDRKFGSRILKHLISMGGKNIHEFGCNCELSYYYIDPNGDINTVIINDGVHDDYFIDEIPMIIPERGKIYLSNDGIVLYDIITTRGENISVLGKNGGHIEYVHNKNVKEMHLISEADAATVILFKSYLHNNNLYYHENFKCLAHVTYVNPTKNHPFIGLNRRNEFVVDVYRGQTSIGYIVGASNNYRYGIPYNEQTKSLVGTFYSKREDACILWKYRNIGNNKKTMLSLFKNS